MGTSRLVGLVGDILVVLGKCHVGHGHVSAITLLFGVSYELV